MQAMEKYRIKGRFQPGVSGNPGGRPKKNITNDWLMQVVREPGGKVIRDPVTDEEWTRYDRQMATLDAIATNPDHPGCVKATELLWAYGKGLPRKTPNALEYAEHLRKIDADRFAMGIALLGERAKTMSDQEAAAFLRSCAQNADAYLKMAQQIMDQRTGDAIEQPDGGTAAALEPVEPSQPIPEEYQGNASPKDRDTADHAPVSSSALICEDDEPQEDGEDGND
jgi:hypothetical protein